MELDTKNTRKIIGILFGSIFFYFVLMNTASVAKYLKTLLSVLSPFILGFAIAFVINVPMTFLEKRVFGRSKSPKVEKFKRPLSMILSYLFVLAIMIIVVSMVTPQIIDSGRKIMTQAPGAFDKFLVWIQEQPLFKENIDMVNEKLSTLEFKNITDQVIGYLKNGAFWKTTLGTVGGFFSGIVNFFLALIFSLYTLGSKEKLLYQTKKLIYAYFPEKKGDDIVHVASVVYNSFYQFITGQAMEAVILGALCFIGMTLLRLPYALMISVVMGVSALIPIVGAAIGFALGVIIILIANPAQALTFAIFFLVLQQVEGNLIYPRVVGSKVGLPAMWVLFSITVGGSLLGLLGMLIFVPLFSAVYYLAREESDKRISERRISLENK